MNKIPNRVYLSEDEMPRQWYNIRADMKEQPDPYIHPGKMQPVELDDLTPVFCRELCLQEVDTEHRFIDIPEEILDIYKVYRPSPLIRAYNLEKVLDTPAKIYYKFEGNNTSGSHKLNTAVAQGYYAKKQGITSLSTETGAGQWGTAMAMACSLLGLDLIVFMVKVSYEQKPYRKAIMETFGANIIPSPSMTTEVGRKMLAEDPTSTGSLGTAISEAIEQALKTPNCRYVLGSVLNHVLLHQSIIGL
ncbi:MAG TPA: TrpB-like pyridoxal phosphate-dependent enzyme, partial [Clostridiales bacterium]|nr:TrpB-like pyridoxal phosphate-dependent enzyme [Clostridiales bacterium]